MKSLKNKSQNSSDRDINKSQNKEGNLKSILVINTTRQNHNENPAYKEENELYNVYQTTSNDNGNEDKMHDILMNISSTFAFTRQKNPQGSECDNKVDRLLSSKSPNEFDKLNSSEKMKFSNTGSFSSNFLASNQVKENFSSTHKTVGKSRDSNSNQILNSEVEIKKENNKFEKTKFEKDIQANLRRMYSQSNKIKIDNQHPIKFKTLTDKYYNNSPKVLKLGNKLKQELANRESIKQFYNEYLSKGFLKTNVDNLTGNDSNNIDASNNRDEKPGFFVTPKSSCKNLPYSTTVYNVIGDKASTHNEKNISSHESKSKLKVNTFFKNNSEIKELNIVVNSNDNLQLKGDSKKKIDYSNLKISKNFRTKISQLSNINASATTQIISEPKFTVKKQSSVKPKVKLTINNND